MNGALLVCLLLVCVYVWCVVVVVIFCFLFVCFSPGESSKNIQKNLSHARQALHLCWDKDLVGAAFK